MMEFKGLELDFDIFEAENADAYEEALENVKAVAVKKDGEGLGEAIRRQCTAVFDFFDDLFGDGFHKELFGEKTNLMECLQVFNEFTNAVKEQKAALDSMMQEITGESGPLPAPNRAARRAATRAAQQ